MLKDFQQIQLSIQEQENIMVVTPKEILELHKENVLLMKLLELQRKVKVLNIHN